MGVLTLSEGATLPSVLLVLGASYEQHINSEYSFIGQHGGRLGEEVP